jgi:hypothetical protein
VPAQGLALSRRNCRLPPRAVRIRTILMRRRHMKLTWLWIAAALACATLAGAPAQAQVQPTPRQCRDLGVLAVAWQNFDTQDLNASLEEVDDAAKQVAAAMDQVALEVRALSPAAFDQLKQAHANVEAEIAAVPENASNAMVQDRIAMAKDNERFAYQNMMSNLFCP